MSITMFVQDSGRLPKSDILRYLFLSERDTLFAHSIWTAMSRQKPWVQVPNTIMCDRTFVRDLHEAMWLIHSGEFISDKTGIKHNPHSNVPAFGHWYEMPGNRKHLMYEAFLQRETGLYLTLDDPDSITNNLDVNQRFFPAVEEWVKELDIPPALCMPVSYTRFCYGMELAHGTDLQRKAQLAKAAREETFALLARQWWNAMIKHNRMYVLKKSTIDELDAHFRARYLTMPGTSLKEVVDLMRSVRVCACEGRQASWSN